MATSMHAPETPTVRFSPDATRIGAAKASRCPSKMCPKGLSQPWSKQIAQGVDRPLLTRLGGRAPRFMYKSGTAAQMCVRWPCRACCRAR